MISLNISSHAQIYQIPSPVSLSIMDQFIQQIDNQNQFSSNNSTLSNDMLGLSSIQPINYEKYQYIGQKVQEISSATHQLSQFHQINQSHNLPHKQFRIKCKNVLSNIRAPIIKYFKQFPSIQSQALQKLSTSKHVTLQMMQKLFKDQQVRLILIEMFATSYLKRQFFQTRADKKIMGIHFRRIRQLNKMFIMIQNK